nr:TAXI family TRAP transporter solute-binding subunit [Bradyrhizobium jicamae]
MAWLAFWYFIPAPPSSIVIATGPVGGTLDLIAQHYRARLAPHLTLDQHSTDGVIENLRLLNDRNSGVDIAFFIGGAANGKQAPELRSLGRVLYFPIWFFYRGPEPLNRLTQLKGKRIGGPVNNPAVSQILAANGISSENSKLSVRVGPAATTGLRDNEVDVQIVLGEANSSIVQSLLRDPGIRLMDVTEADALARIFPYLNRLQLPRGVIDFEKDIPPRDVNLVATTVGVLVHKDVHPEIIYLLAQTLAEEHGGAGIFQRAGDFPTQSDPEFAVAEDARDFYRNGPSFMQRYLPFWMINLTKRAIAALVAVIAIVIPLLNYAPKMYVWLLEAYMAKLYRRLRGVEAQLQSNLTVPEIQDLQSDLEAIDRAVNVLPMRHSDLFLSIEVHIDRTRQRLASRLTELTLPEAGGSRTATPQMT